MFSNTQFDHVVIPFDQLQLFTSPEQNQIFLIQTLLLSTKATIIVNKHKYSSKFIITKHHLWFLDQKKKKNVFALPTNSLLTLIKSKQFPELIFITSEGYDNVHISLANEQRCNSIISGLSYLFGRIMKKSSPLKVYFLQSKILKQFSRTASEKGRSNRIMEQLQTWHPSREIMYKEKGKRDIWGSLDLQKKKMSLMKTLYSSKTHILHVARLLSSYTTLLPNQQPPINQTHYISQAQDYYYVHTVEKTSQILSALGRFQAFQYEGVVEQLVYARQLDYKIQLFFRYHSQLPKQGSLYYSYQLTPERLFINLMEFYDLFLQQETQTVLTLGLVCYQRLLPSGNTSSPNLPSENTSSLGQKSNSKRSFHLAEEHNSSFSQIVLKLRQFRYPFLLTDNNEINKLIYHTYYEQKTIVYDPSSWKTKFYHLALLLYEFLYGQPYFSDDLPPQVILEMKRKNKVIFPKYINTDSAPLMSWELQNFIEKAIRLKFKSLEQVYEHPWMKQNVLMLAYQQPPLISTKNNNQDKKTDATKSF